MMHGEAMGAQGVTWARLETYSPPSQLKKMLIDHEYNTCIKHHQKRAFGLFLFCPLPLDKQRAGLDKTRRGLSLLDRDDGVG